MTSSAFCPNNIWLAVCWHETGADVGAARHNIAGGPLEGPGIRLFREKGFSL